jgi:hypothetical protein
VVQITTVKILTWNIRWSAILNDSTQIVPYSIAHSQHFFWLERLSLCMPFSRLANLGKGPRRLSLLFRHNQTSVIL